MKINEADGSVSFVGGSIDPAMDKAAFLKSPLGSKSERWFVNGAFETYRFLPEPGIVATTDFKDDRLQNVSIVFELPDESMENWTAEIELKRKQKHDEWLSTELGAAPWRYNWAEVVSEFYHQHCGSEIGVFYKS